MTLLDLFKRSTEKFALFPAVIFMLRYRTIVWKYKDVESYALRVAGTLRRAGMKRGDPVILWAENSPYWMAAFWGIIAGGGVVVPLHTENLTEFAEKVGRKTGARLMIRGSLIKAVVPPGLRVFAADDFDDEPPLSPEDYFPVGADETAEIVYTSGTTGDPKGVPLTHGNIVSNVMALDRVIDVSEKDRFLSILPLSHMFEQTAGMVFPFMKGASVIYLLRPSSAAIMKAVRENKATKMLAVPEFLRIVMGKIEIRVVEEGAEGILKFLRRVAAPLPFCFRRILFRKIHKRFGGRLRTIASGGSALDPSVQKKWELFGFDVLQGYGLTETAPVLTVNTLESRRLGSVGKPLPGVQIKIAADGEILSRGESVFSGYFQDEAKTREAFTEGGWFKTGDLGEIDKDGFLYIKGRKKYLIIGPSGQNVYPEDIEFELNAVSGVRDSAVLGIERAGRTEIHAVLLLERGVDPQVVVAAANMRLAGFQKIHNFSVWPEDDFPRSATRKVRKEIVMNNLSLLKEKRVGAAESDGSETVIRKIIADLFEVKSGELNDKTKLVSDLGMDSLLRLELVARIEEKSGVRIGEASLTERTTLGDLEKMASVGAGRSEKRVFSEWPYSRAALALRSALHAVFIRIPVRLFSQLRIYGVENLDKLRGPILLMPNHRSVMDSPVLFEALPYRIRRKTAFALAADIAAIGWFPLTIARLVYGAFPFPRGRGVEDVEAGFEAVGKLLDLGGLVVIYPEGEIGRSSEILPLKRGAGLLAIEMKVPVVPVFISGTEKIIPWGKILPRRRGAVSIRFGEPLYFKRETYDEATAKIYEALKRLEKENS